MELNILRAFNLIVTDQHNLHLAIEEMKLPTFEEKSFDFTPGGSSLEIDVPLGVTNKLEMPFKLATTDPAIHGIYGLPPGIRNAFTARMFVVDEIKGREIEVTVDIQGRVMKVEPDQMKGGEKSGYDHAISSVAWYSETHDGVVIRQFNFFRGGWTIRNGVAFNGTRNRILGIG